MIPMEIISSQKTNETLRLRFIADVYGRPYIDDLTEEQRNQSAAGIIHYLCTERYGLDDENKQSGLYSEND